MAARVRMQMRCYPSDSKMTSRMQVGERETADEYKWRREPMKRRSQGEGRSQKERGGAKNWWRWIGGAGGAAAFTVHLEMFNSIHFRLISFDFI